MFSEQTAPISTYYVPIDSEFHADGLMEIKNGPWALTGWSLVCCIIEPTYIKRLTTASVIFF